MWVLDGSAVPIDHARSRAVKGFHPGSYQFSDGVGVAGPGVGVVGVEALDSGGGPGHTAMGAEFGVRRQQLLSLGGVAGVGSLQPSPELGNSGRPSLHRLDAAPALEPADAPDRQGAGEPVEGGEGGTVLEYRGHLDHDWEREMAAGPRLDRRS